VAGVWRIAITLRNGFTLESCLCPSLMFKETRMGTPLVTAFRMFGAFQQIAGALGRRFRRQGETTCPAPALPASPRRAAAVACAAPAASRARPPRHLRVVRILEGSQAAANAGRMVISGRMADVCAELERLAALEAAAG
jgi:hypothetical protein